MGKGAEEELGGGIAGEIGMKWGGDEGVYV